jgi:hypothetical protein
MRGISGNDLSYLGKREANNSSQPVAFRIKALIATKSVSAALVASQSKKLSAVRSRCLQSVDIPMMQAATEYRGKTLACAISRCIHVFSRRKKWWA